MNFKILYQIMDSWTTDLRKFQKIESLHNAFMVCETLPEVRRIVSANRQFFMDNPDAYKMAERAMMRIRRIHQNAMYNWRLELN